MPDHSSDKADRLFRFVGQAIPWLTLLFALIFISSNIGVFDISDNDRVGNHIRSWSLTGTLLMTALWFIECFSGDADRKKNECFTFAYAFTLGAFAMLVTPFIAPDSPGSPRTEGVIQLIRGCIKSAPGAANSFDGMRCRSDWETFQSAAPAAGTPGPTSSLTVKDVGRDYGWLLSIGGVMVQRIEITSTDPKEQKEPGRYVEVYGGLAVPMFVIVLAFIGGAVSLSRRIPEYQRRSEKLYEPTDKEPAMKSFQARESVVFQIMQLVSAPFLAIATWYIVSPVNLSSAAVLAFGTGFASEPLLLMVRGMVEGIRPNSTRAAGPQATSGRGVRGTVLVKDAATENLGPAAGTVVTLSNADGTDQRQTTTDAKGQFAYGNLPVGDYRIQAAQAEKSAELTIQVTEQPMGELKIQLA